MDLAGGGGGGKSVDLPVLGKTKTVYVWGGVAVVAVIVGYAYWKRAGSSTAEQEPSYYADLRTGSSTGSDAYEGADDSISGTSGSSYYDNLPASITTDQQWTAAVVNSLTYLEPDYLYGILGKYLARQGLAADEAAVVRSAWAAVGRPPGNQQIILATDGSTAGTSKTPGAPTGLKVTTLTPTTITITWAAVAGATSYKVYRSDGASTTVPGASFTTATLKANTSYTFQVAGVNTYGEGARSGGLTVKTPATATKTTTPVTTKPGKPAARPTVSATTVRRGTRGDSVKIIQRIVGAKVDGIFGPETESKVRAWQRAHGLVADGIVGPKTQAKMGI